MANRHREKGLLISSAEARVLALLLAGDSQKEIAKATGLAPSTVGFHLHRLRLRFRARSLVQLAAVIARNGLLDDCPPLKYALSATGSVLGAQADHPTAPPGTTPSSDEG